MIWIDLENTPHVVFFKPIIDMLQAKGYKFVITARDCFQTCELADKMNLNYIKIGRHYGKNKCWKTLGLLVRVVQLSIVLRKYRVRLAVSHTSRTQILLAKLMKIKQIAILDYEFVKMLPFVKIDEMVVPAVIDAAVFERNARFISKYPGIKENVYVPSFKPDPSINNELKINNTDIVATVRPPATEAHYYNPASEQLFKSIINYLGENKNVRMVILPRNKKQHNWIVAEWPELIQNRQIMFPEKAVNGLNLLWHSDMVFGGGGTMNREAAALNVPAYSSFKGRIGAVDQYLTKAGLLKILDSPQDLAQKIKLKKHSRAFSTIKNNTNTLDFITDRIIANYKQTDIKPNESCQEY